ncbi:MAG: DEAD/DEAH box helicase [Bacillota bacterium]
MIILHAAVDSKDRFLLWGETRRESPAGEGMRPLPSGAGSRDLEEALRDAGLDLHPAPQEIVMWMPETAGRLVPSSRLVADPPTPSDDPAISPWDVQALYLPVKDAIELLLACQQRRLLARGVVMGDDLAYWSGAVPFASALIGAGRFLPGVSLKDGTYRATWEPVFTPRASEQRARLARAMPGACRAATDSHEAPPDASPVSVLTGFIRSIVDALMREQAPPSEEGPTLHDRWLIALHSPDGTLEGEPEELEEFAAAVRRWQRRLTISSSAPFSLVLRLEEPDGADDEWTVRYMLRAVDDPSLLLPADAVWSGGDVAPGIDAGQILLAGLGQAAALCPEISRSLRSARPAGFQLDTAGAYRFLTRRAPALRAAGFAIILPSWWTEGGARARPAPRPRIASPSMTSGSGLSLDDMVELDWEVAVGDETLSREELEALADLKVPLVKMRGQWTEFTPADVKAIRRLWEQGPQQRRAREVLPLALESDGETSASGWVADLLEQLSGECRVEELPQPTPFRGSLRPYQLRGYSWLSFLSRWGLGGCLADDMGLGKTVQTLALIQKNWEEGPDRRPTLIICPTSVLANWRREASRFTPDLPLLLHHGPDRNRKPAAFRKQVAKCAIVLSSYGLLPRDVNLFTQISWGAVVLDEAQNIKNPGTKRARAARRIPAGLRLALTGTPVENHVGELWSLMEFANPGLLGTQARFRRDFFLPIQREGDEERAEKLRALTSPFILRRLKTDRSIIDDLPEKMEMKVHCSLTREQATLYTAAVRKAEEAIESAEGIDRRGLILATLTELKQVCDHPALLLGDGSALPGRSGKLARLTEMLEEIVAAGERALIFSQFARMGRLLRQHLQETFGLEALFLHGGVPAAGREEMVERFQDGDGPPFFILSLRAGGTGLNLTRANHVFHYDRWWNPAVEDQATDRAFRIGQDRDVYVHKFIVAGTLEERIDRIMEEKLKVADSVIGSGERWLTEMSAHELKEILRLGEEEVIDS